MSHSNRNRVKDDTEVDMGFGIEKANVNTTSASSQIPISGKKNPTLEEMAWNWQTSRQSRQEHDVTCIFRPCSGKRGIRIPEPPRGLSRYAGHFPTVDHTGWWGFGCAFRKIGSVGNPRFWSGAILFGGAWNNFEFYGDLFRWKQHYKNIHKLV